MFLVYFLLFSVFIIISYNRMANYICVSKELSEQKQIIFFRWINILSMILIVSSYIKIMLVV